MRSNQFGGQKGCGTDHFLAHLWTGILENLEDSRGCNSLISLDFAKAFNRLDHTHILESYARLGACTEVIRVLASFLHGRTMRVKVAEVLSGPRPVNGGAPQGSCAGVQMYSVGTDDIDEGVELFSEKDNVNLEWSVVDRRPRALSSSSGSTNVEPIPGPSGLQQFPTAAEYGSPPSSVALFLMGDVAGSPYPASVVSMSSTSSVAPCPARVDRGVAFDGCRCLRCSCGGW